MVDEARLVPTEGGVDHRLVVDREEERVMVLHGVVVVASVGLRLADALADVLDEARPLADAAGGEGAHTLHGRAADLERERGRGGAIASHGADYGSGRADAYRLVRR